MSRIYVLQAPRLAVAAARMKADVNYVGLLDAETASWLEENHVFIRDMWEEGELTRKRLQRLYHRLFPGDFLLMDGTLPGPLQALASEYAVQAGARVVIGLKTETSTQGAVRQISGFTEILIHEPEATWTGTPQTVIPLKQGENLEAWTGAFALCLMNGLSPEASAGFCRRVAAFADLPWYDEVAYDH
ncbi:hypothetical protein [Gorillibacterium massiliense]|uniref:hypothetical protein n=1 Tax=Gorillibacterium massiliense TaxID=1280390 RepID=UPI0004B22A81|nr:hypothetical protein [Gorillibacterium massiliense]